MDGFLFFDTKNTWEAGVFLYGRGDPIWTDDLTVPNGARYQAAPHPDKHDIVYSDSGKKSS